MLNSVLNVKPDAVNIIKNWSTEPCTVSPLIHVVHVLYNSI